MKDAAQKQNSQDSAPTARNIIIASPHLTTPMDFDGAEYIHVASLDNKDMYFSWIVFKKPG
jgi:hypothetical protein